MYPMIPAVVKVVLSVAAVGGGVVMLKDKGFIEKLKRKIPLLGSNDSDGDIQDTPDDLTARDEANAIDDLQKRLEEAESRAIQLEMATKELRSENLKLRTEVEVLRRKLEEAKRLSFDYFPDLLKWLQKTLGKSECGESDNIEELASILSLKYGLTVNEDYANIPEGFVCVKDAKVTVPEISLPMLARGDDIELKGIVKVPMSFAGAEPPVDSVRAELHNEAVVSDKNGEETDSSELKKPMTENGISVKVSNECYASVSNEQIPSHVYGVGDDAEGDSCAFGNEEARIEKEDDFIITTKERTKS